MRWPAIKREVVVDHATREAKVTFVVETGPIAGWARCASPAPRRSTPPSCSGACRSREGEPYDPAKVKALRDRLTSLGVFNSVRIKPATALDANGELPIDVELTDRPPRSIGFGVGYETQLGFVGQRLLDPSQPVRPGREPSPARPRSIASARAYTINDTGFAFSAAFRKPDWWLAGQDARLEAAGRARGLDAYTRKAVTS